MASGQVSAHPSDRPPLPGTERSQSLSSPSLDLVTLDTVLRFECGPTRH